MSANSALRLITCLLTAALTMWAAKQVESASITYIGVIYDRTDFDRLNIGNAGYWFPQFAAASPVSGRPTGENARDALPAWAGPLNHATSPLDPNYATRTFSQDGPARSKGGQPTWNPFKLPSAEAGLSGAIVDPFTRGNSNNTINRIQLNAGVPSSFYFHVVTDNTNFEHNPTNRLRARGNSLGLDIDANTYPQTAQLAFNGIADVYTFRYDGFAGGDYIKLQLNGDPAPALGASFAGFMFDTTFEPNLTLPRAGDYNRDDTVDAGDYVVWRKTFGQAGYFLLADGDSDNQVDADDHAVWAAHFGDSAGFGSGLRGSLAVPEPGIIVLLLLGGASCVRHSRPKKNVRTGGGVLAVHSADEFLKCFCSSN
jgi:hypothetical protein